MNDIKIKQQIADKIKSSTNILVTVSNDPSVDALSAALGLTVMLNKLGKHATAVFSGAIPPAITFLDPEKTFENTADSLRDFIIALDKEKADHLRYKVEGDVVKIFITPYRTTITSDDLDFSQGDYNVELVLALGVDNPDHLDSALEAHGRILHDATVATITAGDQTSSLGSIDWSDRQASSLSEMLVSLSESIKDDGPLLDAEIATALLTGIVAQTDRFSNERTSSRVMTMAAQLMAAGADQQLIAAKLQESHEIEPSSATKNSESAEPAVEPSAQASEPSKNQSADGGLSIDHYKGETLEEIAKEVASHNQKEAATEAQVQLAEQEKPKDDVLPEPTEPQSESIVAVPDNPTSTSPSWTSASDDEPLFGGTLNATTEQAAEDTRNELADDQNRTILTHSYLGGSESAIPPINASGESDESADIDIFSDKPEAPSVPQSPEFTSETAEPAVTTSTVPTQTLAQLDSQVRAPDHDEARAAVEAALGTQIASPAPALPQIPVSPLDLPAPPPLPDFANMPPQTIAPAYALDPTSLQTPERLGDILAPEATLNPIPTSPVNSVPPSDDPGQFRIPGQ